MTDRAGATPLRVLLVGAGGHARVCLEAIVDDGHEVVGAVSADGVPIEGFGVAVVGLDTDVDRVASTLGVDRVFVAIGDNAARSAVTQRCDADGLVSVRAVSRFACVSRSAVVHDGAALLPGSVVNAAAVIGRGAIVNSAASVDHDCRIGEFVHVANGAALGGGVRVGAGTLVGLGARVMPHVTIGARAVIGAGALVVHDVPDGQMVTGVPARQAPRSGG